MSDTICVYPWMNLSIGSHGEFRPCCNAIGSKEVQENIKDKENYDVGTLLKTRTMSFLRDEMLQGKRPELCSRCWNIEDSGNKSFRDFANSVFREEYDRIVAEKSPEPIGIVKVEFDLDAKCNLKCRMCGPFSSSLIRKEVEEHPEAKQYYQSTWSDTKWIDAVDINQVLSEHIHTIRQIYLIGGEPLIIDENLKLLKFLCETGAAKNIALHYNTNGMNNPYEFIEYWKQFREVHLGLSIDGYKSTFEYIRYPGRWKKIEKNLLTYKEIMHSYQNIHATISTTLQNLSLDTMAELIRFFDTVGIYCSVIPVNSPDFLQPDVMPEDNYYLRLNELREYAEVQKTTNALNKQSVEFVIKYLESRTANLKNPIIQNNFVMKQQLLDKIRKQNVFETYPWAVKCLPTN